MVRVRGELLYHLPHFHVYYGEYQASFVIIPPGLLEGGFPQAQLRLVLAWAEPYFTVIEEETTELAKRVRRGELRLAFSQNEGEE